ncbi:MAG: hypothetical protein IKE24_01140 [Clostridia bacterium]|nr:hypothetical protein [Clostridia bacterium]
MKTITRTITALILSALLLLGSAYAAETPPVFILDSDGITETPVAANYSWTYLTGNQDEWRGVEACGMGPTDPAVPDSFDHVPLMEDRTYNVIWAGTPPDELTVFSWDTAVFTDQEHIDDYQKNTEIVTGGQITLKPDRVYDFQAKWSEHEDQEHGLVHYYLLTEKLIMEDGPGSIMMGGWTPAEDPTVTEERKAVFDQGTATLTGAAIKPVAYLGSQVVAGTNHAFLCQSMSAYPGKRETEPSYVIVYLYQDLQGNVSIINIADFDIGSLCTY